MFKILDETRFHGMFTDCCFGLYETGYTYGDSCDTNSCKTPINKESEDTMNLSDLVKERIKNKPFIGDCFIPNQTCYSEYQANQYCAEYLCCTVNDWNDNVTDNCNGLKVT